MAVAVVLELVQAARADWDLRPGRVVVSDIVNLYSVPVEGGADLPSGYRRRVAQLGPTIGAEQLGGSVYELDPGDSVCPYHYENIEEEWLLVLTGTPDLRDPEGDHALSPGDLVCFVEGPDGAHKVTNRSDTIVRILMLSTKPKSDISICIYPDSDKVGVYPPGKALTPFRGSRLLGR
jgi:uncharacterized cupin superfamily protein